MGNWTTVNIEGSCPANEVDALRDYVNAYNNGDYSRIHCLSNGSGLYGLGDWANEGISVTGNLFERGFGKDDVAETLKTIGELCPNADIKVHVGGDYESLECVATVHLNKGRVNILDPERKTLAPLDQSKIAGNLMRALKGF